MLKALDRNTEIPLHQQLELQLRAMIRLPAYQHGETLPAEVDIAKELEVSRSTVRTAMGRLESEGLIERKPRIGTRVCQERPRSSVTHWYSFTREMQKQGLKPVNFELLIRYAEVDSLAATCLQVEPGTKAWMLRRVRGSENQPALLAVSWLHPELGLTGNEDFNRPLYDILAEVAGVRPNVSREELCAVAADEAVAAALDVEAGAPILHRQRVILDADDRPIEFNQNFYRSDRHRLTIDLAAPGQQPAI